MKLMPPSNQPLQRLFSLKAVKIICLLLIVFLTACNKPEKKEVFVMNNHSDALPIWLKYKLQGRAVVHVDAHDDFIPVSPETISSIKTRLQKGMSLQSADKNQAEYVHIGNYLFVASKLGIANQVYWIAGQLPIDNESVAGIYRNQLIDDLHQPEEVAKGLTVREGCMTGSLQGVPFSVCGSATIPHLQQTVLLDIDIDYFIQMLRMFPGKSLLEHVDIFRRDLLASGLKYELVTICKSLDGGFTPIEYSHLAEAMKEMVKNPAHELTGPFWETFRLRSDADYLIRSGDISGARKIISTILAKTPDDPQANYLLASILADENNWGESLKHASTAAQHDKEYVFGLVNLAQKSAPINKKIVELFIAAAEKFDADNYALIELRANIAFNLGNFQKAADNYLKIYLGNSYHAMYLGDSYLKLGNYPTAKHYYDQGLAQLNRQSLKTSVPIASSLLLLGEYLATERHEYDKAKYYFDMFQSLPLPVEEKLQGAAVAKNALRKNSAYRRDK